MGDCILLHEDIARDVCGLSMDVLGGYARLYTCSVYPASNSVGERKLISGI